MAPRKSGGLKVNLQSTTAAAPEPGITPFAFIVPPEGDMGTSPTDATQPLYAAGMVLSTDQTIADYWRLTFAADASDPEGAAKMGKASTDKIMGVLRTVKIERDMTPTDIGAAYLAALVSAPFMVEMQQPVPTGEQIKLSGVVAVLAKQLGEALDDQTLGDMTAGVKAQIDADASSYICAQNLRRQFRDMKLSDGTNVLSEVPPMGTKNIPGQQGNRAPAGYKLPSDTNPANTLPVWNGHYNKERTENRSGAGPSHIDTDWIEVFTASARDGAPLQVRADHIRAAMAGAELTDRGEVPADVREARLDAEHGPTRLATMLVETTFQFNRRKQWYTKGFDLLQSIDIIEGKFKHVKVESVGGNLNFDKPTSDRLRKPLQLVSYTLSKDKKAPDGSPMYTQTLHPPMYLSRVLGIAKGKAQTLPANTGAPALMEQKRGTKATTATPTPAGAASAPAIASVQAFQDTLNNTKNYLLGDKENIIKQRVNDPKQGPEFCNALVYTFDTLKEIVESPLLGVREKSDLFLELQGKAQRDAAIAEKARLQAETKGQGVVDAAGVPIVPPVPVKTAA